MKKRILLISLLLFSILAYSQCDYAFGKWNTTHSAMPSARSSFSAIAYHDSIYVLGGFRNLAAPENVSSVDVYIPASNTWLTGVTEFPFPRGCMNACLIRDKIYAFGGSRISGGGESYTAYDSLHIYNIKSNTWERGQCLPEALAYFAADTLNGKIYVVGGGGSGYVMKSTLYLYDPELDEWTQKASLSAERWGASARSWNGKLYLFGGYTGSNWTITKSLEVYDPVTNEWTELTGSTIQRTSMVMYLFNGQLFVMGGYESSTSNQTKIISRYDIASDTWFNFFHEGDNMPEGRRLSASTVLDDKLYFFGGGAADIMGNAWSYTLKSISQVKEIQDSNLVTESIELDFDDFFSSTLDDVIQYSICDGYDEEMIDVSLENSTLTIDKLSSTEGNTELSVNVFNSLDTVSSNVFTIELPGNSQIHFENAHQLRVYPNPASNMVSINFEITHTAQVILKIYNLLGQKVEQIDLGKNTAGVHSFEWNVKNYNEGLYYVVIETGGSASVSKLLIQH
ncbi:MAG: T9SS type A sorting domain-containing protein [Bacteroidales bacterium]|nr:T9SS type A sorting domain-containing protein [Bacteroidales bacterium]MBN2821437.1 T9SS type A sorting domain-containing protein [Bacteroidales bacterium]